MSSGIVQLVAVGVQDMYLSGNPEVSFFRSTYKRYTHFAASVERQMIQGNANPRAVSTVRFEKKGDLLSHVYFTSQDVNQTSNVNADWSKIIDRIDLLVGGQIIDTQDYTYSSNIEPVTGSSTFSQKSYNGFYPLKFFFCKDWASALPLVALQYHDVELRIYWGSAIVDPTISCWARFIYLDEAERAFFAKKSHDMLITQVTRSLVSPVSTFEFALAQPVKYIAFESNNYTVAYNTGGLGANSAAAAALRMKAQVNGNDLGELRSLVHWTDINQYYNTDFGSAAGSSNVAIIPFCLNTSKIQPSGSLNFSRIDTFRLLVPSGGNIQQLTKNGSGSYFYAVNYNILRIQNGQGGLLYSS
jgi:hypothetical protein